jgi:hypothetical protein
MEASAGPRAIQWAVRVNACSVAAGVGQEKRKEARIADDPAPVGEGSNGVDGARERGLDLGRERRAGRSRGLPRFETRRDHVGRDYFFFATPALVAASCFFCWSAAPALACFWPVFFWLSFGDRSPIEVDLF